MAVEQSTSSERVLAARERYVPRGIATPPIVVARALYERLGFAPYKNALMRAR